MGNILEFLFIAFFAIVLIFGILIAIPGIIIASAAFWTIHTFDMWYHKETRSKK